MPLSKLAGQMKTLHCFGGRLMESLTSLNAHAVAVVAELRALKANFWPKTQEQTCVVTLCQTT